MEDRREAEHDDCDGPFVVDDELPQRGIVVANRFLDLSDGPVYLPCRATPSACGMITCV